MTVSIVARVVRIPVIAAVVVPMLVAACSNDPLSPRSPSGQRSSNAAVSDGAAHSTSSGGSIPWYKSASINTQGGSIPWYKSASISTQGGSIPWY